MGDNAIEMYIEKHARMFFIWIISTFIHWNT